MGNSINLTEFGNALIYAKISTLIKTDSNLLNVLQISIDITWFENALIRWMLDGASIWFQSDASFQDLWCEIFWRRERSQKTQKRGFVKREKSRPIPEKNISHFGRLPDNTKKIEGNWSQIFCWCHSQVYCFFVVRLQRQK